MSEAESALNTLARFATGLLDMDPVEVYDDPTVAGPQVNVTLRVVAYGRAFYEANSAPIRAFALFHEVGHVYAVDRRLQGRTAHDVEFIADWIGGWLCAAYGIDLGGADHPAPMASNFGATVLDGVAAASLPVRVALTLGLRASATHPAGTNRAEVVTDGYLARTTSASSPLLVPRDDDEP